MAVHSFTFAKTSCSYNFFSRWSQINLARLLVIILPATQHMRSEAAEVAGTQIGREYMAWSVYMFISLCHSRTTSMHREINLVWHTLRQIYLQMGGGSIYRIADYKHSCFHTRRVLHVLKEAKVVLAPFYTVTTVRKTNTDTFSWFLVLNAWWHVCSGH